MESGGATPPPVPAEALPAFDLGGGGEGESGERNGHAMPEGVPPEKPSALSIDLDVVSSDAFPAGACFFAN